MNPENTLGQQIPQQAWPQTNIVQPPPQTAINGNYQQQILTTGMSAMTINPTKQNVPPPMQPVSQSSEFNQYQAIPPRPSIPATNGVGTGSVNNNMNLSNNNGPDGYSAGPNIPPQQSIPNSQGFPGGVNTLQAQQISPNAQNRNIVPGQFQQPPSVSMSSSMKEHPPTSMPFKNNSPTNANPLVSSSPTPQQFPVSQANASGYPPVPNVNQRQLPPGAPNKSPGIQQQTMYPNQQTVPGMPPRPMSQQMGQPTQSQVLSPQSGAAQGMYNQPSGYPAQGNFQSQPNMPQPPQHPGMPAPPQHPGIPQQPPHPGMPTQHPGMPPHPQHLGMPPQPQHPGMPPQPQHPGMPPQPQHPGMPQQPQHPGMPPQPQHPGMPPQPQHPGMPPQPQHPGMPPQPQHPAMPPQPGQFSGRGYQPPTGVYNAAPGQYPQPAAQRRLDPDQMPNPIQVMVENQRTSGGLFVTNQPGLLPPLVTTKYVAQDQGNSSPRFLRSSLYSVPATSDLLKQTALPFTLIISPLATTLDREITPPIVDFGELGPVRCLRCKAYMSPNMQFIDAGRRFQCLMCKANTEVPTEYFQHLDHTGQRIDKYERPELVLGTYEFIATKDYCREGIPPTAPAFIFIIDVSYNNVKSGLVHLLCREIRQIIQHFPVDQGQEKTKMKVGFITYNNTVHFYNLKSTLAQPQMMVVGDVHDMFMPLLDGFLVDPEESDGLIDALMEQIPEMFGDTKETETILLPAIQAGLEALKASNCAGKLLVFNSSLPIADAPGKLKNRDDRKVLGTEKEKSILVPQCTNYNDLGRDCVLAGCSVDLFIFNNSYVDIATAGQVSRLTGGEVYKYTYFQADIDGNRLIEDIIKNVSRPIAFDAVMRVRTSAGIRPTDFYGHFFMSNTTDMELSSIDSDKAIAIEIKHDDKLSPEENVYVQVALLYTSCGGQRRLRVMNLVLKSTIQIADVFKSCDLDAMVLFLAKQSMFKIMELSPKSVKDNLIHRSAQVLACYRKNCTSPTSAGQLILPECLKLLPLYVSCMIKNDAFSGGSDMSCDDRSFVIQFVLAMDLPMSVFYFYPRLIPIFNVEPEDTDIPLPIRCTYEKMVEDGAYILENGIHMFLWLGMALPSEFLQPIFGVQCTQQVNTEQFTLPNSEAPLSKRIRQIIESIKAERTRCMRMTLVKQGDKMENIFRHFLVEDRGTDGTASYVDFLCHMHKEIKDLLS